MNGKFLNLILVFGFICIFHVYSQNSACSPPTLKPGSTWISSPNCSGAYTNGSMRCHCWGHCGYICSPSSGTAKFLFTKPTTTTATTTSTTTRATTATATPASTARVSSTTTTTKPCNPPRPQNSIVTLTPNCTGAFSTTTHRCHCWGFCALICDPL